MNKDLLNDNKDLTLSTSLEELGNKAEQVKEAFDKVEDIISSEIIASFPKPKFELGEKVFYYNATIPFIVKGIICRIIQGVNRTGKEETVYRIQDYPKDFKEYELHRFPR